MRQQPMKGLLAFAVAAGSAFAVAAGSAFAVAAGSAFAVAAGLAFAAHAADVSKADAQKVRAVVRAQLAAFATDDAKRAFSYAAPGIRRTFGTAERFIAMVREGYPVVYRPASVAFLKPEAVERDIVQAVQMSDADGTSWLVVYRLERQPDHNWRISGVRLVRNDGRVS